MYRFILLDKIFLVLRLVSMLFASAYISSISPGSNATFLPYILALFVASSAVLFLSLAWKPSHRELIYKSCLIFDLLLILTALFLDPDLSQITYFVIYFLVIMYAFFYGLKQSISLLSVVTVIYLGLIDATIIQNSGLVFLVQMGTAISLVLLIGYLSNTNRERLATIRHLNDRLVEENNKKEQLLQELEKKRSNLKSLFDFSKFIAKNIDTREIFNKIIDFISTRYKEKKFIILFKDQNDSTEKSWHLFSDGGKNSGSKENDASCFGISLAGKFAEEGSTLLIAPAKKISQDSNRCWFAQSGDTGHSCHAQCAFKSNSHFDLHRSYKLIIPIVIHKKIFGAFIILSDIEDEITVSDKHFFQAITNQISIAVEKRMAFKELKKTSETDSLTGLYNRNMLIQLGEESLKKAKEHKKPLALLFFDLDHFKAINDKYGHTIGDDVLKHTTDTMEASTRTQDILARYGGEEFVLLLPEISPERAMMVAEKIRKLIEKEIFIPPKSRKRISLTISCGIAVYPRHGKKLDTLIQKADEALYRAKNSGRNRVEMYRDQI